MQHEIEKQPDYGIGEKKLGIYLIGLVLCVILTLIAFGTVMVSRFSKELVFIIIYSAAVLQFIVQVICFLRLNSQTEQGRNNVMSFIFTGVIMVTIIIGSLWIMWNINYNMDYM